MRGQSPPAGEEASVQDSTYHRRKIECIHFPLLLVVVLIRSMSLPPMSHTESRHAPVMWCINVSQHLCPAFLYDQSASFSWDNLLHGVRYLRRPMGWVEICSPTLLLERTFCNMTAIKTGAVSSVHFLQASNVSPTLLDLILHLLISYQSVLSWPHGVACKNIGQTLHWYNQSILDSDVHAHF